MMAFFFLMCSERSGSNFITKVMNGHEDVCGPSTKHIINPVARNFFRYKNLQIQDNWNELLKDINNLLKVKFSEWRTDIDYNTLKKLAPTGDLPSLIKNIFIEEAKANGKSHIFVKENQVYEFITYLVYNFPEAKFIYQVRDPRDMALSWQKNKDHKGGVVCAAEQWKKDQMQTLKNHQVLNAYNKSFFLKYEELITKFDLKTKELCDFLGIPHSEKMKSFHKDELTRKNANAIPAWQNLAKDVIENNMNKYEYGLETEEIKIVEKICYPEMQFFGYIPKFSYNELNDIDYKDIDNWRDWELKNLKWEPNEGVKLNMAAKKKFYQKIIL